MCSYNHVKVTKSQEDWFWKLSFFFKGYGSCCYNTFIILEFESMERLKFLIFHQNFYVHITYWLKIIRVFVFFPKQLSRNIDNDMKNNQVNVQVKQNTKNSLFWSSYLPALVRKLTGKLPACFSVNPLRANPTKWSNTFKQFVDKLLTNCLSVFDHFVGLALKGLRYLLP